MQKNNVVPQGAGTNITPEWVWRYFRDVDSLDPAQVVQHYHSRGTFQFSNQPPVEGQKAITELLANFYQQIQGMDHPNTGLWLGDNSAVFEAVVTFTRQDGSKIEIPAISTIRRKDSLIESFLFVMDASPIAHA